MEETPQGSNKQGEVNPVRPLIHFNHIVMEQSGPIRRCEIRQMEQRLMQKLQAMKDNLEESMKLIEEKLNRIAEDIAEIMLPLLSKQKKRRNVDTRLTVKCNTDIDSEVDSELMQQ